MSFPRRLSLRGLAVAAVLTMALSAHATLPAWLQHIVGASTMEAALYRTMHLPQADVLYPRPPKEAEAELGKQIAASPDQAELYQLRARSDEAALDVSAAEDDWKLYAAHSKDPIAAKLEFANFYRRQLATRKELAVLQEVAQAPNPESERYADPATQRAWLAFNRALDLIAQQGLPQSEAAATYDAFLARYPEQPAVYGRALQADLDAKNYPAAEGLIARFRKAFPHDETFPVRAEALLAYTEGDTDRALAVYDKAYEPLWPADLVQSYFALLTETHRQRAFVADARTKLAANPDGPAALNALTRIFYYDQQAGRLPQAQATLDSFRIAREQRNGAWSAADLDTLAALERDSSNYAEAARYNFALSSTPGTLPNGEPAAQAGLAALTGILLSAPDQPLALGAGNLTLYRDIATLDGGPGYWNGILSLWLNGTSPATEYQAETDKAQSYFHRAKAAELLAQLDSQFPNAPERPALHAQLIHALAQYGEPEATAAAGKQYLADFPQSPGRIEVGGLIADAYARENNTAAEFALYDQLLNELAASSKGMPLSAAGAPTETPDPDAPRPAANEATTPKSPAYALDTTTTIRASAPGSYEYSSLLDRYIARLTATQQLPQALLVLRHQLDRNPADPALYERLANFLQQNNLTGQQEQLYKQAIARFAQPTWYDKLARFYLRQRNQQAFAALTRQVTDIFSGTELDPYFARVREAGALNETGPALAVQLNLYAAKRFPHDLVFTRNLLTAYQTKPTENTAAYATLLRQSWWESDDLRQEFFAYLSRTGKLQSELAALTPSEANPAALREQAEIDLWSSHFEQAAVPFSTLANLYPAEPELDDRAVSIFRSLAYLDPTPASLTRAVAIETNLLRALPDSPERLATLGDLYAEATGTGGEDLRTAEPYWRRIPDLHPGTPAGALTTATIFWDYFQYDDALAQIGAARQRFHQPTLYGYEAGAIEENRRDLPAAIHEYTAVVVTPPNRRAFLVSVDAAVSAFDKPPSDAADSNLQSTAQSLFNAAEAHDRLLKLAVRPSTAKLVDEATASAAANSSGTAAITLRADVLLAQKRPAELPPLLNAALARATTVEEAEAIGNLARIHANQSDSEASLKEVDVHLATGATSQQYAKTQTYALTSVYEASLAREAALSTDPVEKLQFQYELATAYEERKDLADAGKLIASIYSSNPRLLGVVRATVDYYDRTDQPKLAVATLLDAARAATPTLARGFTLEASAKANRSGDYAQGRALALTLLPATPYDPQVLALVAASYARANDNAGLKNFYLKQLDTVKTAPLSGEERKADTALLRRGLIPALTRLKDYDGATAQYIALLSAYPEDSGTAQEAALYALRYGRQPQLLGFLEQTVKASPRDSRFSILLAQTETTFEDVPAAIAAYDEAIAVRKDRADLYQARAALELRLNHTDPAAADYERLYLLSYKDPQWLVRLAELRVRQHRNADAVKALQTAYIEGRPASATNQFTVAAQLLQWNLLPEARTFADSGRALAGSTLFTGLDASGAVTYARILTRQGQATQAFTALAAGRRTADASPVPASVLSAELTLQGLTEADAADLRKTLAEQRRDTIKTNFNAAASAIGDTVDQFYTPEQKLAYAQTLDTLHTTNAPLALAAAAAAHLADREAAWRKQELLTRPPGGEADNLAAYTVLQQKRLAFAELAQTLELYAARLKPEDRREPRTRAAQAWHDAGGQQNPEALANELRLTRTLVMGADAGVRDGYLDLLLRHDPAAFATFAASSDETFADAAVDYVVAHGTYPQAASAVRARGAKIGTDPQLWSGANLALTGLYLAPQRPETATAFEPFLLTQSTIADRLRQPANPAQTLTGDLWFAFASRDGIAQLAANQPAAAEDVLPALLEQTPTLPAPYVDLARTYAEAGNTPAALAEYAHALELQPNQPGLHDEIAVLQSHAGNAPAALAEWRAALDLLRRTVVRNSYSESFYSDFKTTLHQLGQRHLTATLKPEIDAILEPEFAKNGNYRSNELLEAVYKASATPEQGTAHILALSSSSDNPAQLLEDLHAAPWLNPPALQAILARRVQLAQADTTTTAKSPYEVDQLVTLRQQVIDGYLAAGETAQAQAALDAIPQVTQQASPDLQRARIQLAARTGRLPALLADYAASPDTAPALDTFTAAANQLSNTTPPDQPSARLLRQYIFDQKQLGNQLTAADFLLLAQSRILTGDLASAVQLLQRLALRPPDDAAADPNTNADSAAALLESTHHEGEAVPFLKSLTAAAPWNATYRLRLAQAQAVSDPAASTPAFLAIARDPAAPYETRAQAAEALAAAGAQAQDLGDLGSAELTLIATPHPSPAAVRRPYYLQSRLLAADPPSPEQKLLLREAVSIAPDGLDADRRRLKLLELTASDSNPAFPLALLRELAQQSSADTDAGTSTSTFDPDAVATDEDDAATPSTPEDPADPAPANLPALAATLDLPTRIHLAEQLSEAYTRNHDSDSALAWLLAAQKLDAQNSQSNSIQAAKVEQVRLDRRLLAANKARRPVLAPDLRRPVNVRPRLTLAQFKAQETP